MKDIDSDDLPWLLVDKSSTKTGWSSPTDSDSIVINPEPCYRLVDRGPPADNIARSQPFLDLGGAKAGLRRFKDGAIVHAVVWDDGSDQEDTAGYVRLKEGRCDARRYCGTNHPAHAQVCVFQEAKQAGTGTVCASQYSVNH